MICVSLLSYSAAAVDLLVETERQSFPATWQFPDTQGYFSELLQQRTTICLVATAADEVIGHLITVPFSQVEKELQRYDTALSATRPRDQYIETMAVRPKHRRRGAASALLLRIAEEARVRGAEGLLMHARVSNGLSALAKRMLGADLAESRLVASWPWLGGKQCEYLRFRSS